MKSVANNSASARIRQGAAILAGSFGFLGDASGATLLSENFEGLTLGPIVSGSESGGDGTDWTDVPPAGWTRDNSLMPVGSPLEFRGFTFLAKTFWIATSGDQDRSMFTRGSGTVMVADPDEFDDGTEVDPDLFRATVTTSVILLNGFDPSTLTLDFDSSFRPYDGMTATVDVSFDGGTTFSNALTYNTANSGGDSSLSRVDEAVSLNLAPFVTSNNLQIRFGLANAGNDWWWAIDNLVVSADPVSGGNPIPEASSYLAVLGLAGCGLMAWRRRK